MKRIDLYLSKELIAKALSLQEDDIILTSVRESQCGGVEFTVITDDNTNLGDSSVSWASTTSNLWILSRNKVELKDVE